MMPAPVLIFVYKRLDCLAPTIKALQANKFATQIELFIFSDNYKAEIDAPKITAVREYLQTVSGFKKVTLVFSEKNKGLARSIREGVSQVFETFDKLIVLEDDLLTSQNFLAYMNQALDNYENNPDIFSVSGYTFPIPIPADYKFDTFFNLRACSWGWGTWKNRWQAIDWQLLKNASNTQIQKASALGNDYPALVNKLKSGKIDSWAVPWCYQAFINNQVTVYPILSKVQNMGFSAEATHTSNPQKRFSTLLDVSNATAFNFQEGNQVDKYYAREFAKNYSLISRLKWRLFNTLNAILKTRVP